jgi:hypothetical protein
MSTSSLQLSSIFAYLPEEVKIIIYEYDPNRRNMLNQLCNEIRFFVPYWFNKKGNVYTNRYMDIESRLCIFNKNNCSSEMKLAFMCDNCPAIKCPKLILLYIRPVCLVDYGGLYCDTCLANLEKM